VLVPEIYDPAANTWTVLTGASRNQILYAYMMLMPDGRVYESGARDNTAFLSLSGTGSWSNGPTNSFGSSGYAESSAMYGTGKILRAGGGDPSWANAAVINVNQSPLAWRDIAPMAFPRRRHNCVILLDGQVMAMGGTRSGDDESKAILAGEIWNPVTERWTTVASMKEARMYHSTGLLLADGRVMAGGGEATGRLHAEIYSPPYLFKGARPTISSAPSTVTYGSTFIVSSPQAADIVSVAMLRPGAVTHTYDHNQRYIPLSFTTSGSDLTVTAPANGNVAPPGYHLLVIKNGVGVPSVASWVRLGSSASLVPGTITGLVTNAGTGAAISGATVSYTGGTTTTATNGSYTLSNVPPGDHLVTASKTGFASSSQTKTVPAGTTVTLNFALVPPGTVSGRVTNSATGAGIQGATVSYNGGSVITNSTGNYTAVVPSGSETLTASATGYENKTQTVNVPANGSVTVNFALDQRQTTIQGEVDDAVTFEPIVGATVSYSGGSTTTDEFGFYLLPGPAPGTYTVTASAPGFLTASSQATVVTGFVTTADFSLDKSGSKVINFAPAADARIKASSPTRNYGTDPLLRVLINEHVSYLKFDVSGLSSPIESATLSLFCTSGSSNGGSLYAVSNSWSESTITWNNAPLIPTTPIVPGWSVDEGQWVDFDVKSAIAGNGTFSFALKTPSNNTATYSSREGTTPPSLRIVVGSSSPPPAADFSADPRSGDLPLTVNFTDLSTGSPTSWLWTFGDGGTSTEQNPVHVYRGAGAFNVMLAATNAGGTDQLTRQGYITVNPVEGSGPVEHHASVSGTSVSSMMVETDEHVGVMMGCYLVSVATKPYVEVTGVEGLGLTWKKLRSQCGARAQSGVAVFVGEGEPLVSEHVMATFAKAPSAAVIVATIFVGTNPENPIGNVISGNTRGLNAICSGGTDTAAYSFQIPVSAPGAAVYGAISIRNRLHTPGAGYTERFDLHAGSSGDVAGLAVMDKVFGEPTTATVNGTLASSTDWAMIAVEVVP
jgi:PKD repeat protein